MKTYATLALILSTIVLIASVIAFSDARLLTIAEIAPYLIIYTVVMLAFATAAFQYVLKMERRRLSRRKW